MGKIKITEDGDRAIVSLPKELGDIFTDDLMTESKGWLLRATTHYIFDFKGVLTIKPSVYRGFIHFARIVRQGEKKVSSINMSAEIQQQIKTDGVATSFNPLTDIPSPNPAGDTKPSLNAAVINAFVSAVRKTIEIQAQTPCQPGKPFLMKASEKKYKPSISIVAIINLSTSKFSGSLALAFNEQVFLKIYENMFAEKHDKINAETQDTAAELLNIIYGLAKTELNQTPGIDFQLAIPTVLTGEGLNILQNTREKIIVMPFESSAGIFQMELALEFNR